MICYETGRLRLRNYQPRDVQDYYAYMRLDSVAEHENFDPFTLNECMKAVVERLTDDLYWAVELKENGKMIGDLSFSKAAYNAYEIAYDFNPEYGGKGYATEACGVLLRHIFTVLNGRRLYVGCNEGNAPSWRLLERLGLRREAHCIEDVSFKNDADGNPVYVNSYYYGMLKREWEARQA